LTIYYIPENCGGTEPLFKCEERIELLSRKGWEPLSLFSGKLHHEKTILKSLDIFVPVMERMCD
jgi:hypothetical protein